MNATIIPFSELQDSLAAEDYVESSESIEIHKKQLLEMENMAINATAKMYRGANELAIALHEILSNDLFIYHLDENTGFPLYPTLKDYEPYLLETLGVSRATMYKHYTPIRIACGPTFELDYEQFVRTGGKPAWEAVQKNLNYDRRTGEVTGLLHAELEEDENLREFVLEHLQEIAFTPESDLNLTEGLRRVEIERRLTKGNTPIISYNLHYNEEGGFKIRYTVELGDETLGGYLDDPHVPSEIVEDVISKLRITL